MDERTLEQTRVHLIGGGEEASRKEKKGLARFDAVRFTFSVKHQFKMLNRVSMLCCRLGYGCEHTPVSVHVRVRVAGGNQLNVQDSQHLVQ